MSELQKLKDKRTSIKSTVTRQKTFLDNAGETPSRHELIERRSRLAACLNQFNEVQAQIEVLENASDETQKTSENDEMLLSTAQYEQHEKFEAGYFSLLSRFDTAVEKLAKSELPNSQLSTNNLQVPSFQRPPVEPQLRLPRINLPTFSGSYHEWHSFYDTFDSVVNKNSNVPDIEKFIHLKSALKDQAAEIIESLEVTAEKYVEAWEMLKNRYDNKRWIIQGHIKAIFELEPMQKECYKSLRTLLDGVQKHLRALKALKRNTDKWDDLLIHIVVSKIDKVTGKEWETSLSGTDMPTLQNLIDFLSKRCQALESISSKIHASSCVKEGQSTSTKSKRSSLHVATTNISCPKCKGEHFLYHCKEFLKLNVNERFKAVKAWQYCINCLKTPDHKAEKCESGTCRRCGKGHNTLLHFEKPSKKGTFNTVTTQSAPTKEESNNPSVVNCSHTDIAANVLLSTAIVDSVDSHGARISCRALLDCGSQMNFISSEFAKTLDLEEQVVNFTVVGVGEKIVKANRSIAVKILSRANSSSYEIDCTILPKISHKLPQNFVTKSNFMIPSNIKMADPNFNIPADIDLLIGADLFWRLICKLTL